MNSGFGFPPEVILVGQNLEYADEHQRQMLDAVDAILIDEVSMVRSDVFQAVDTILRHNAPPHLMNAPCGGKQTIVIGDFFQLGPVVESPEIAQYLNYHFGGAFAFQTQAWRDAGFENVILRQVYRQRAQKFQDILRSIRSGELVYWGKESKRGVRDIPMSILDLLNERCCGPCRPEAVTLCPTRAMSAETNASAMQSLPGQSIPFAGKVWGEFPERDLPTELSLNLKIGSKVMMLARDPAAGYINGDVGEIVNAVAGYGIQVILENGGIVNVTPYMWENYEYALERDNEGIPILRQHVIGRFTQLPVTPAYALTIHKSQGASLNAVRLALGHGGCFAPGQLYTALSRCRSLRNLSIDRPLDWSDSIVAPEVINFYRSIDPLGQYNALAYRV